MESERVRALRASASSGDLSSLHALALCYLHGHGGVAKAASHAAQLLRQGADGGHAPCARTLAQCCYYGDGVARDPERALDLFARAASSGDAEAMGWMGFMYEDGAGTAAKDVPRALAFYKRARAMGFTGAEWRANVAARIARAETAVAADPALARAAAAAETGIDELLKQPLPGPPPQQQQRGSLFNNALKDANGNDRPGRLLNNLSNISSSNSSSSGNNNGSGSGSGSSGSGSGNNSNVNRLPSKGVQGLGTQEETRMASFEREREAFKTERVQWQAKAAVEQQSLNTEMARLKQLDAELQRRKAELDALDRQRIETTERAAAFAEAQRVAAAAKQAELVEARREAKTYAPMREAVVAAWTPTKVKLLDCPVCVQPIAPSHSVLLNKCLHGICRNCAPHMVEPSAAAVSEAQLSSGGGGLVTCPVCKVVSALPPLDSLPHHPFIEAELAGGQAHDCVLCRNDDEETALPATFKCTTCSPDRHLCEGHATLHRQRMPTHTVAPLPHGGVALRCPDHNEPIAAYCTGCRALICLACTLSAHQGHPARLLTDTAFIEALRARLAAAVASARAAAATLVDHAADATVAVSEVAERDAAIQVEVNRAIGVLARLIERRREAAHEQRLVHSREELEALQQARDESAYHWRIITSAADLAEQLAEGAHLGVNAAAVLAQLEEAATARLTAVLTLVPQRGVPAPSVLRFEFDESIGERLVELGRIVKDA